MIKTDPQIIKNVAFGNRVVDLNSQLTGYPRHGGGNQRFTFVHEDGEEYRVFTIAEGGDIAHISSLSSGPSEGDTLAGGEASSIYTVRPFIGYYHISIDHNDGTPLFWTLTSGVFATKITLHRANNKLNQLWCLSDVPG